MKNTMALIGICCACSLPLPAHAQERKVLAKIEIPSDAIDQNCGIVLHSTTRASTETDNGKIVRFDDKSVVLVDATWTVSVESSVPILGSIPYLGRLFRNVGIGREKVPGELSIDRRNIKSVQITR